MSGADALSSLLSLGIDVISTAEAAALLRTSTDSANKVLRRLGESGLVAPITRGLWSVRGAVVDPLLLPEHLTAPLPAYISLQTALHLHGMIEQIPSRVFAVSLGRSRTLRTHFGTFSIHRVAPEMFGGFVEMASGAKVATPEKALLDVLYLSATRARIFSALPELELPRGFDRQAASAWVAKIRSPALATMVDEKWRALVGSRRR